MSLTGRGDMWITEQYMLAQNWLAPRVEEFFMWPQHKDDDGATFIKESVHTVRKKIVADAREVTTMDANACMCRTVPLGVSAGVSANIDYVLTSDLEKFGFSDSNELVDIDGFRSKVAAGDRVAVTEVYSIRFDEPQHLILALRGHEVVAEAWTVEERHVRIHHVKPFRLQFDVRNTVFMCDPRASMYNDECKMTMRRTCRLAFYHRLPTDVIDVIAYHLATLTNLTARQFYGGQSAGVMHYANARLLRIGWHRRSSIPSVKKYYGMSATERRDVQKQMSCVFRYRNGMFSRQLCHKRTRSGQFY